MALSRRAERAAFEAAQGAAHFYFARKSVHTPVCKQESPHSVGRAQVKAKLQNMCEPVLMTLKE